ncbi:MAG: peptidyl-prolyl cis-trans isomerase [Myxococcota bacterium]|nr:peptidyl-prolyl cis-trans isomerase [Myxococcota bacterium]
MATVGDERVTQSMVDAALRDLPASMRMELERSGEVRQVVGRLVLDELLYQEAVRRQLHLDPEVRDRVALAARSAQGSALLDEIADEGMTEEAVQQWYQDHLVRFARPQVKARHIELETEEDARTAHAELLAGADFEELARTRSQDPGTAASGGTIGWFTQRDVPSFIAEPAFALQAGEMAEPFQGPRGWHVLKVDERREQIPIEEVRGQVELSLRDELKQAYVETLQEKAQITWGSSPEATSEELAGATEPVGEGVQ